MSEAADKRAWRRAALMLGVLAISSASFRMGNLDIWLHAATGEWILDHGEVPSTNVLSELHHDYPSVHDKWGFQVLAHLLLDELGPDAVDLARILLVALLVACMAATARGLGASPGATVLCLALGLLVAGNRLVFRPGLLSLVLLAAVLQIVLVSHRDGRRAWWLLLLQLLWVNVHGYFVLGWLTVFMVAGGQLLAGQGRLAGRWLGWGTAMMVVCLANPAGWAGWIHPFVILDDLNAHREFYTTFITEFRPILAADPREPVFRTAFFVLAALTTLLLVWESGLALVRRAAPREPGVLLPSLVLVVAFGLMATSLRRNIAPFAVVAGPLAAAAWTSRLGRSIPGLIVPAVWVALISAGQLSDVISLHDGSQRRSGFGMSRISYPLGGIGFIGEQLPDARVFTAFRYGSTFTGLRRPAQRAATNGNTHGYPTSYLEEVLAATADADPAALRTLARRYRLTAALLPMAAPLAAGLLRADDWVLAFIGREEVVFVSRSSVEADWLAAHDLEQQLSGGEVPPVPQGELFDERPWWRAAPGPTTLLLAAQLILAGGYPQAAEELAARAVAVAGDDPQALGLYGLLMLRRGDRSAARELLRRSRSASGFNILGSEVSEALARLGEG